MNGFIHGSNTNLDRSFGATIAFMVVLYGLFSLFPAVSQEDLGERNTDDPEEVIQFYKDFISLYMDQYLRLENLQAMRASEADEEASEVAEDIRQDADETLSTLRDLFRTARQKGMRNSLRNSMAKTLKLYPLYIKKIVNDWQPSDQQVLKRRRMNKNHIIRQQPELATPSLLRRVFLGEILSSAFMVREVSQWIYDQRDQVDQWISDKYNELFPLYDQLLSRVLREKNDDETGEEELEQVITDVRNEWNQFWTETGQGADWQKIRNTTNRLNSLFRNRNRRLPGSQQGLSNKIRELRKQIGDLQQLQMEKPFTKKTRRLRMIIGLSKSFANRALTVGNGSVSRSISTLPSQFVSDYMDRTPEQFWSAESIGELEEKRKQVIGQLTDDIGNLKLINYESKRERYNFPVDSVLQLTRRLGTGFGKKELQIAKHVRDIAKFVQARYQLSKAGVNLMITYRDALQEREFDKPQKYIQFDKQFREEYEPQLSKAMSHVKRIRNTELEDIVEDVKNVSTDELAAAYKSKQTSK